MAKRNVFNLLLKTTKKKLNQNQNKRREKKEKKKKARAIFKIFFTVPFQFPYCRLVKGFIYGRLDYNKCVLIRSNGNCKINVVLECPLWKTAADLDITRHANHPSATSRRVSGYLRKHCGR